MIPCFGDVQPKFLGNSSLKTLMRTRMDCFAALSMERGSEITVYHRASSDGIGRNAEVSGRQQLHLYLAALSPGPAGSEKNGTRCTQAQCFAHPPIVVECNGFLAWPDSGFNMDARYHISSNPTRAEVADKTVHETVGPQTTNPDCPPKESVACRLETSSGFGSCGIRILET